MRSKAMKKMTIFFWKTGNRKILVIRYFQNFSTDSKENLDLIDAKVVHGISYRKEIVQNFPIHKDAEVYPMNNRRRGKCVIFNNKTFNEMGKRDGTENDQKAIEHTFTNLGFEVISHPDLDYVGIMEEAANCMSSVCSLFDFKRSARYH